LPEAIGYALRYNIDLVFESVVLIFVFGKGDVVDELDQPAMVEPVDAFERKYSTASKLRHGSEICQVGM
jgi:hypothetical protein